MSEERLRNELEARALHSVQKLSEEHPNASISFFSRERYYLWFIDGSEVRPAEAVIWDDITRAYGYGVLPTVQFVARNGKVTRETDW